MLKAPGDLLELLKINKNFNIINNAVFMLFFNIRKHKENKKLIEVFNLFIMLSKHNIFLLCCFSGVKTK